MAPVVDVDDGALDRHTHIGGVDHLIARAPRRVGLQEAGGAHERDGGQGEIGEARQPAAGHEGVEIAVVRVLAEEVRELQRPDPERTLEAELGAQHIAPEPAEMAHVIALVEGGAFAEQVAHLMDRQERGEEKRAQHRPHDGDGDDADALAGRSGGQDAQPHNHQRRKTELPPGGPREGQQQADQQDQQQDPVADHGRCPADQDALKQQHRRKHQERAQHVGIIEGAARAAIEHEQIRQAAEQMKIGRDAGDRSDQGGGSVAAQQMGEARLGIGAQDGGIEHRGDGEEDRDQHPGHRFGLARHLHDCDGVTQIEHDQHQGERHQGRAQRQPGEAEQEHAHEPDDLIGAGFDEHEGAGKAHAPEQEAAHGFGGYRQGAAGIQIPAHIGRSGRAGVPRRRHQYAFRALNTANGVLARM